MNPVLRTRQLIPPLAARAPAGQTIRAWDFKQKKNLVVVFLDAAHPEAEEFIGRLVARTAEIAEQEAVALVVFSGNPPALLPAHLPAEIIVATDISGRAARAYLGDDAFGVSGQQRSGAFVADRYGELYAQWVVSAGGALPGIGEILSYLRQLELACDECGVSHWPVGE